MVLNKNCILNKVALLEWQKYELERLREKYVFIAVSHEKCFTPNHEELWNAGEYQDESGDDRKR